MWALFRVLSVILWVLIKGNTMEVSYVTLLGVRTLQTGGGGKQ